VLELLDVRALGAALRARVLLPEPLAALERWLAALPPSAPLLVPPALVEIR